MEIKDYLGTLRKRFWILVVPPVVAGVTVEVLAASRSPEYRATATVAAPALIGSPDTPYAGPNGAKSFVSDFTAVLTSERTVQQVAAATGVPARRITTGLRVRQVGTSTLMQVTFRTRHRAEAEPVATAAAGEVMRFLPRNQVDLAASLVEQAQKTVSTVQGELDAFTAESGVVVPDRDYQVKSQQVSDLERQAVEAAARGETGEAAHITAVLPAKRAELAALAPKVAAYGALADRKSRAEQQLAGAQSTLNLALAFEQASDPATVVTVAPTRQISRADAALRKAAVAVGASLFLAIGFVALLEPAGRRHLRFRPATDSRVAPSQVTG